MVAWSCIRMLSNFKNPNIVVPHLVKRHMSGHDNRMTIDVSRWQWNKYKDLLHFYALVGIIPMGVIILYTNIFIGPAKLAEIPEGYTPKHWEYYRHPITRFIARYIQTSYQQEYEKHLHHLFEEDEKKKLRKLSRDIKDKMAERHDYQAYYYRPVTAKYFRQSKQMNEELVDIQGENC